MVRCLNATFSRQPTQEDSKQDEPEKGVEGTESTIIDQEITTHQKFSDISIDQSSAKSVVVEKKPHKRGYMHYKNAKLYPITYHSGTFSPTQVNWSANTKEAYVIFKSITRMSFFVTDSKVIVPLRPQTVEKVHRRRNSKSESN